MVEFLLPLSWMLNIVIIALIFIDNKKYKTIMKDIEKLFIEDYKKNVKNGKEFME